MFPKKKGQSLYLPSYRYILLSDYRIPLFFLCWLTRVPREYSASNFRLVWQEIYKIMLFKYLLLYLNSKTMKIRKGFETYSSSSWVFFKITFESRTPVFLFLCYWWEATPWNKHTAYQNSIYLFNSYHSTCIFQLF